MKINLYSLENNFVKAMRVKIGLNLRKYLVPSVNIPLSTSGSSIRVVWIDFRYKCLPQFYYHYELITYDTKMCMSGSGLNVRFGDRHANYGEWLCFDLLLCTLEHVNGVMSPSDHDKRDIGTSRSLGVRNDSRAKVPDAIKCTNRSASMDMVGV